MGLCLKRKLNERVYVGDAICITVVDITAGAVRLLLEAPQDVKILRHELLAPDDPRRQWLPRRGGGPAPDGAPSGHAIALAEYAEKFNRHGVDSPEAEAFRAKYADDRELSELMALSLALKKEFIAAGLCSDGPAPEGQTP